MKKYELLKHAYSEKKNRRKLMNEFNHCTNKYEFVINHPALFSSNFLGSSSNEQNNQNNQSNQGGSSGQTVSYEYVTNYSGVTYSSTLYSLSSLTVSATSANNNMFKTQGITYVKQNEKTNLLLSYRFKEKSTNAQAFIGCTSTGVLTGNLAMATSGTYKDYKPGMYVFFYNNKASLFILDMPDPNSTETVVVASIESVYTLVDDTLVHFHINYTKEGNITMNVMLTTGTTIINKLYHARYNRSKFYQGILLNYNINLGILDDNQPTNNITAELVPSPIIVLNDFLSIGSDFYDYFSFNKGLNQFSTVANLTATDPDAVNGTAIFKSSYFSCYTFDIILSFKLIGSSSDVNAWSGNIAFSAIEVTSPLTFPVFNQDNPGLYHVLNAVAIGQQRWGYNYILDKVNGTGSTNQGMNINNINYSDSTYAVHVFYNFGYDIARICVTVSGTIINKYQYVAPNNSLLKTKMREGTYYVGIGIKDSTIAYASINMQMFETPTLIVESFRSNLNNPTTWITS